MSKIATQDRNILLLSRITPIDADKNFVSMLLSEETTFKEMQSFIDKHSQGCQLIKVEIIPLHPNI